MILGVKELLRLVREKKLVKIFPQENKEIPMVLVLILESGKFIQFPVRVF